MENLQTGWTRVRTTGGRFEYQFQGEGPTVLGALHQSQTTVVSVSHLTHEIEIASRGDHGG